VKGIADILYVSGIVNNYVSCLFLAALHAWSAEMWTVVTDVYLSYELPEM